MPKPVPKPGPKCAQMCAKTCAETCAETCAQMRAKTCAETSRQKKLAFYGGNLMVWGPGLAPPKAPLPNFGHRSGPHFGTPIGHPFGLAGQSSMACGMRQFCIGTH